MKKAKIMAGLLVSTSLVGTLLGGTAAFAAAEGGTGHSDVEVLFERGAVPDGEDIPGIDDGEDGEGNPSEPDEDDNPIVPPGGGEDDGNPIVPPVDYHYFRLIYIPTVFGFGSHQPEEVDFSTGSATFAIANDTAANPSTKRVAVGDHRGTRVGWELTAELAGSLADGEKTLEGATINVDTVKANRIDPNTWNPIENPRGTPTIAPNVKIGLEASPIMTAPYGLAVTGSGIWEASLSDIELEVPGAASENIESGDSYTGIVVWILSDVPSQEEN